MLQTRKRFLTFDSSKATRIIDTNNSSGVSSTPYKSVYNISQQISALKRISLASCELPVGFFNVRTGYNTTVTFNAYNNTFTATLIEKNYTAISTLLSDLNTACTAAINGTTGLGGSVITVVFSLSSATIVRVDATNTGGLFSLATSALSKSILGFVTNPNLVGYSGLSYVIASNVWNLAPDQYISMFIPTFNASNPNARNGLPITFKIPLNQVVGSTISFYSELGTFKQFVDITDPALVFSQLTVILYDQNGLDLNPYSLDFTFTLSFEQYIAGIPLTIQSGYLRSTHFDSRSAQYSKVGALVGTSPHDALFTLIQPILGLTRVYLSSCEIPVANMTGSTNYLQMYISSLQSGNAIFPIGSGTFKIPINILSGQTQSMYYSENLGFQQYVDIPISNGALSQLKIQLLDRNGIVLSTGGFYDYSFTLLFEGSNV